MTQNSKNDRPKTGNKRTAKGVPQLPYGKGGDRRKKGGNDRRTNSSSANGKQIASPKVTTMERHIPRTGVVKDFDLRARLQAYNEDGKPHLFVTAVLPNGIVAKRDYIDPAASYQGLLNVKGFEGIIEADLIFYHLIGAPMEQFINTHGFEQLCPFRVDLPESSSVSRVYSERRKANGCKYLTQLSISQVAGLQYPIHMTSPDANGYSLRQSFALASVLAQMRVIQDFGWDPQMTFFQENRPGTGRVVERRQTDRNRSNKPSNDKPQVTIPDGVSVGSEDPRVRLRTCDQHYKPQIILELRLPDGNYVKRDYLDFADSYLDVLQINDVEGMLQADLFFYFLIGALPMAEFSSTHGFARPLYPQRGTPVQPLSPSAQRIFDERNSENGCHYLTTLFMPEIVEIQKTILGLSKEKGHLFRQSFTLASILAQMRVIQDFGFQSRLVFFLEEMQGNRQSRYGLGKYLS